MHRLATIFRFENLKIYGTTSLEKVYDLDWRNIEMSTVSEASTAIKETTVSEPETTADTTVTEDSSATHGYTRQRRRRRTRKRRSSKRRLPAAKAQRMGRPRAKTSRRWRRRHVLEPSFIPH